MIVQWVAISLSNEILDSKLKSISKPSQTQTYIGITIQHYEERFLIDPDFSVLLSSNSASSKSNSICNSSRKLSNSQIAGIAIGGFAFITIFGAIIIIFLKRKTGVKISMFNIKLAKINKNDF